MADSFKFVQNQLSNLAGAGATIGDTTIDLSSFTKLDGTPLTMTDFGTKGYGTLEPGSIGQEEAITFTGVTQNGDGTAVLTGVSNQMTEAPYTETSGLDIDHAGGTGFVVSNTAGFYNAMSGKGNDETVTGIWTFTAPNYPRINDDTTGPIDDEEFTPKSYVDGIAIAGAAKATETVYGIAKLTTAAVSPTEPIVVGDNDTRVPTQDENNALAGTSGTPSSTNKYVTADERTATPTASKIPLADANGKIADGWLNTKFGGTGADGALNVTSGTTTLAAGSANVLVKNYSSINIDLGTTLTISGAASNGTILVLKSSGNVTIAGAIDLRGFGGSGGTGVAAATAGNAGTTGYGIADDLTTHPGNGGTAGTAGSGSVAGGTAGTIYSNKYVYITADSNRLYSRYLVVAAGSGGASGGGAVAGGGASGAGGNGGGGLIIECAGTLTFTGTINVSGANGVAAATNAGATGGGGAGGSTGMALVLYNAIGTNSGTITATGGAGGAAGTSSAGGGGDKGGAGGGAGGSYDAAGVAGGAGTDSVGNVGVNGNTGTGGGGGGGRAQAGAGAAGGNAGASSTNSYKIISNTVFM